MSKININIVNSKESLDSCIQFLSSQKSIALDLEFDKNRFRYGFNLCLIQLFAENHCFLIDPLAEDCNTSLLFSVFENPAIQKVVFAFGEDQRLLNSLNCFPKNLYDLSIAAKLLNYDQPSLSALILAVLDIDSPKSQQMSNWYKRPLTEAQLKYAAEDVIHLLVLLDKINEKTESTNVHNWIQQENKALELLDYSDENQAIYKNKDKQGLSEYEWFIYEQLLYFREDYAKKMNKPPHQIINKDYLKEIALDHKKTNYWETTRGTTRRLKNPATKHQVKQLIKQAAFQAKEENISNKAPALPRLSKEEYTRKRMARHQQEKVVNEVFKPIQKEIEEDYGVFTSKFILGNKTMQNIASGNLSTIKPYQFELIKYYGNKLSLPTAPYLLKNVN